MNKKTRLKSYVDFMPVGSLTVDYEALDKIGFFEAPASKRFHGAYEGGLFDHSLKVAIHLVDLTENLGLKWSRPESPYIVGMYHDLCKVDDYAPDPERDGEYINNPESILCGHGDKSVILLQQFIKLTPEEIACIRWHMGAYERDPKIWDYYGRAVSQYPNVLFTHTADMIASHVEDV